MLRRFAIFFIVLGLSYIVQELGWAEQPQAFFAIDIAFTILFILGVILLCLFIGEDAMEKYGASIALVIGTSVVLGISIFATWAATKLFNVSFFIAYEIMSFGQCLWPEIKKED